MIAEADRFHGVVLKELLVEVGRPVHMGVADASGRVDTFRLDSAAFQIKYSSKRLSPWQFTYLPEHIRELIALRETLSPVWVFLVCGHDGVVGLPLEELLEQVSRNLEQPTGLRVSRARNEMYRVTIAGVELNRAKPRGVESFLAAIAKVNQK